MDIYDKKKYMFQLKKNFDTRKKLTHHSLPSYKAIQLLHWTIFQR